MKQIFNEQQLQQLELGSKYNIDIMKYADPIYDANQMKEIRLGLKNGIDVSDYIDPIFTANQMRELRLKKEEGLDIITISNLIYNRNILEKCGKKFCPSEKILPYLGKYRYDIWQLEELNIGIEHGVNISKFADSRYDSEQMRQLRLGLEEGININCYSDSSLSWQEMEYKRQVSRLKPTNMVKKILNSKKIIKG